MAGADDAVVQGLPFDNRAGPVMARLQVLCGLLLGATCTFSNTNSSQIWSYLTGLNFFLLSGRPIRTLAASTTSGLAS